MVCTREEEMCISQVRSCEILTRVSLRRGRGRPQKYWSEFIRQNIQLTEDMAQGFRIQDQLVVGRIFIPFSQSSELSIIPFFPLIFRFLSLLLVSPRYLIIWLLFLFVAIARFHCLFSRGSFKYILSTFSKVDVRFAYTLPFPEPLEGLHCICCCNISL